MDLNFDFNKKILEEKEEYYIWHFDEGLNDENSIYLNNRNKKLSIFGNFEKLPKMEFIRRGFYSVLDEDWIITRRIFEQLGSLSSKRSLKSINGDKKNFVDYEMEAIKQLLRYQTWKLH